MFVKLLQKFCFIGMALTTVSLLLFSKKLLHVTLPKDGKDYWVHILFVLILNNRDDNSSDNNSNNNNK